MNTLLGIALLVISFFSWGRVSYDEGHAWIIPTVLFASVGVVLLFEGTYPLIAQFQ